jgi:DNA-binding beta-propeller fold protein YncE
VFVVFVNLNLSLCLLAFAGLSAAAPASAQRFLGTVATKNTPAGIAVDAANNKIYVSDYNVAKLTVIDGATNTANTIGTLPVNATPGAIAYSSASGQVYVANARTDGSFGISKITISPLGSAQLTTSPALTESMFAIATDPGGNAWALGNSGVYRFGTSASTTATGPHNTPQISAASGPVAIAVSQTGRVYVANRIGNNVTEFDSTNTPAVSQHTDNGNIAGPQAITINNTTNRVYVADFANSASGSGSLTVINGAVSTNTGATTVAVGANPVHIAVNESTNKVYVVNKDDNSVTVLDGAAGATTAVAVVATITNSASFGSAGFNAPLTVAVNPVTNRIYVLNSNNTVTTINGVSNLAVNHATHLSGALAGTQALAVVPATNRFYIADGGSNKVGAFFGTDAPRDYDGDERSDVIWQNGVTGQTVEWQMNGLGIGGAGSPGTVSDLNWQIQGAGDFDGDGRADVLWQNRSTGQVVVWLMNGLGVAAAGSPNTVSDLNWQVQATGDLDGNGKADIVWQNRTSTTTGTGTVVVWLMNGLSIASSGSPNTVADLNWQILGTGDFDGDGKSDVLWKNGANGQTVMWLMNGIGIASSGSPGTVADLHWQIQGTGDYDGDGKTDVFWRNVGAGGTGQTVVWLMNGLTVNSAGSPNTVGDLNWQVQNVK